MGFAPWTLSFSKLIISQMSTYSSPRLKKKKKKEGWLSALEYGAQMWIRNTGREVLPCFKIADHLDLNLKRDFQSYRASGTGEDSWRLLGGWGSRCVPRGLRSHLCWGNAASEGGVDRWPPLCPLPPFNQSGSVFPSFMYIISFENKFLPRKYILKL